MKEKKINAPSEWKSITAAAAALHFVDHFCTSFLATAAASAKVFCHRQTLTVCRRLKPRAVSLAAANLPQLFKCRLLLLTRRRGQCRKSTRRWTRASALSPRFIRLLMAAAEAEAKAEAVKRHSKAERWSSKRRECRPTGQVIRTANTKISNCKVH